MAKNFIDILRGQPVNARLSLLPDGKKYQLIVFEKPLFTNGLELEQPFKKTRKTKDRGSDEGSNNYSIQTARRAKNRLKEYILSNSDLDLFVTLTLNQNLIERTDIKEITVKLKNFCDNRVRRNALKYVLVPEFHSDGKAYHFHGFFNSGSVKLAESGLYTQSGQMIYNVLDWKLGFTTAIKVYGDSRAKVANYVGKYITKQMKGGKIAGRYYYHGGDLKTFSYEYFSLEYNSVSAPEIEVAPNIRVKILNLS